MCIYFIYYESTYQKEVSSIGGIFLRDLEYIDRKNRVLENYNLILNKSDKHENIEIFVTRYY